MGGKRACRRSDEGFLLQVDALGASRRYCSNHCGVAAPVKKNEGNFVNTPLNRDLVAH